MSKKKPRVTKKLATISLTMNSLSVLIQNENGIHSHVRNGVSFHGKQAECKLCQTGSPFEQAMGKIGA